MSDCSDSELDLNQLELEITPDPDQLDREWVDQPKLRMSYGVQLANAKRELAQAKADLEVTESELAQAIRLDPQRYGLDKITEAAVKNVLMLQPAYQACQKRLIRTQHAVDVMFAVISAIEHKKSALEDLVRLRLADYYSECRAPEGAQEQMDRLTKEAIRRRGNRGQL